MFRMTSLMNLAQIPALLLGLVMTWAYFHWRAADAPRRHIGWLIAIGAAAGWAAITRPVDALVFAIPVGAGMFVDLLGQPPARWLKTAAVIAAAAAPFLVLQLVMNKNVTGNALTTPFRFYADRDYPNTAFGFHPFDPTAEPKSVVPQKKVYYDKWVKPMLRKHRLSNVADEWRTERLLDFTRSLVSNQLLMLAAPLAVLALTNRRRWVVVGPLGMFVILYSCYVFFLPHYMVTVAPATSALLACGELALRRLWPSVRRLTAIYALAVIALAGSTFPEVNRFIHDQQAGWADYLTIRKHMQDVPPGSVVLFHYTGQEPSIEPVYNWQDAWPDDASIVRAHDLPGRRREIASYYADKQPWRVFYEYDRKTNHVRRLGTAAEVAAMPEGDPTAPASDTAEALPSTGTSE
jgi:hypothetical protein